MSCQAQSIALSAPAQSIAVAAAAPAALEQWADYSPENVDLAFPELPAPDYKCYAPPQVPPGQTRYLKVDEAAQLKNLEQNFNDVRTAIRENNTHLQRNKTQITNINRNHNHLLRIVTNENNFEHNLTNKIVRVADTHRQRIENVKGETRNFKDFKQTQKVEAQGCRRADVQVVQAAPVAAAAPAITVQSVQQVAAGPAITRVLAPSTPTQVQYLDVVQGPATTLRSVARLQ
jgi:TolA-binding protein